MIPNTNTIQVENIETIMDETVMDETVMDEAVMDEAIMDEIVMDEAIIDETTVDIAETFNKSWFENQWQFKALVEDIQDINYNEHTWQYWSNKNNRMSYPIIDSPNTIINTSCEHIENFSEWYSKIPTGKLVILQSNDYFEVEEHVNCSKSISQFSRSCPMKETLFEGELFLPDYTRFMKIGYK